LAWVLRWCLAVVAGHGKGCGGRLGGFLEAARMNPDCRPPREAGVLCNAVAGLVAGGLGSDHGDFDLAAADAYAKITALLG
jgi:hypothetical protein